MYLDLLFLLGRVIQQNDVFENVADIDIISGRYNLALANLLITLFAVLRELFALGG